MLTEGHDDFTGRTVDNFCCAGVNFTVFIYGQREHNRNRNGEDLGDLPVGVIRFICGFRENVIFCYLRTAGLLR